MFGMTQTRTLEPEEWELWDAWMRANRLLARQLERGLQRDSGVSKAEFSVLMTLWRASSPEMRVGELAESLDWDKGRVVQRTEYAADGRRAGIALTAEGRRAAESAVLVHAENIRRHFLEPLTPEQATVIRAWSEQMLERIEPPHGETTDRGAP
jgi:DNA-binding MarR family transcriptional regulator